MSVQILLNQTGAPAGTTGQAREDLVTGLPVSAQAIGGPFSAYLWTLVCRPIDIIDEVQATTAISAPTAAITLLDPIDVFGTYNLQIAVDSGSGLGATEDDVAQITFYAGVPSDPIHGPLNSDPAELPRRLMAFREKLQHNVPDLIQPLGNTEGWSREWYRLMAMVDRMYQGKSWAAARVLGDPVTPVVLRGFNIEGISRTGTGLYQVTLLRPMPDTNYMPSAGPLDAKGSVVALVMDESNIAIERSDNTGTDADLNFWLNVQLGI